VAPIGRAADSVLVQVFPGAGTEARFCEDADTFFGEELAERERRWYGPHLRALGERPLCVKRDAAREVYRLTWLPAHDAPAVVRVDRVPNGYRVQARIGGGMGGHHPAPAAREMARLLDEAEARDLSGLLSATGFWSIPTLERRIGLDGAQWILEGLVGWRYHVVDRWSPSLDSPYRHVCEWLLALSGLVDAALVRRY
jgi:hypothetical protein